MSIIAWVLLGLIAGWIASKMVEGTGQGLVLNLVLGVIGAFVGGFLMNSFGSAGVTGLNVWSIIVAVLGAVVVLWLYNALARRRTIT